MKSVPTIHYCNTDLDLIAPDSLESLAAELEARHLFVLHVTQGDDGLWYARFETDEEYSEPEPNIARILDAIESLPDEAREIWNKCTTREFNSGYDCGDEPWAFNQGLTNRTLHRLAAIGATFRITIYPYRDQDPALSLG